MRGHREWIRPMVVLSALLIVSPVLAEQAPSVPREDAEKLKKPDPTPPPRGTMSFVPLPELEKQPLTPSTFVVRAAIGNMFEIEMGELALQRAEDPAVREYAKQMVTDHRNSNEKLRRLAIEQKVAMPGTVDEEHRKLKQELQQLKGKDFETRYIDALAREHQRAVKLFESAQEANALPKQLKNYADETLEAVQKHRQSAQALRGAPKQAGR